MTASRREAMAALAARAGAGARCRQLVFAYAPRPPFASGAPELAGADLAARVRQLRNTAIDAAHLAVLQARPKHPN